MKKGLLLISSVMKTLVQHLGLGLRSRSSVSAWCCGCGACASALLWPSELQSLSILFKLLALPLECHPMCVSYNYRLQAIQLLFTHLTMIIAIWMVFQKLAAFTWATMLLICIWLPVSSLYWCWKMLPCAYGSISWHQVSALKHTMFRIATMNCAAEWP
jgi:hypothetical protein